MRSQRNITESGIVMQNKSFLRNVIGEYMTDLGKKDSRVTVVNADLAGTCRNRGFQENFPERSFNVGIAEQNMVSFAAGLACEGFVPYAFSMAPFLTMRACEQCRTDVAYGNRQVRLIGVYAGVSGGISGATHWAIEDCGIMTSMPGMDVYEVSDAAMTRALLDYSLDYDGPMYIRSSVEAVADIYPDNIQIKRGGSITVCEGDDGAILCTGVTVQYAVEAAKIIQEKTGKSIRVVDMYSIKPIDRQAVIAAVDTGRIVVVQDHNTVGGLGSIVAMIMAEEGKTAKFRNIGVTDKYVAMAHPAYLYELFGMDTNGLVDAMTELLKA